MEWHNYNKIPITEISDSVHDATDYYDGSIEKPCKQIVKVGTSVLGKAQQSAFVLWHH